MEHLRRSYLRRLPTVALRLQEALDHGELDAIRELGHRLRGSAGAYGLPELSQVAARVEECPDDALHDAVIGLIDALRAAPATRHPGR